ncbi:MAG: hypothetical protein GXO26_02120 [Crenarchaeota archaeon]|nr:hypothetical protein [Thermoproteota archaeon]
MLRILEIETPQGALKMEFTRNTILVGEPCSGKSMLLKLIHKTLENIDKIRPVIGRTSRKFSLKMIIEIPQEHVRHIVRRFQKIWNIDLSSWDRRILIAESIDKSRYEYVLKISMVDEPILHVVSRDSSLLIRKPIDMELKVSVEKIQDLMKTIRELPQAHMFSTYEEEILLMTDLIDSIVTSLKELKIYRIGPYIDYSTCINITDIVETSEDTYIGIHGEKTLLVLSRVFADGRYWPYLARLLSYLEKNGLSRARCGIVDKKLTLTYIMDGELITCPEISCSIRSLIAYYVQILVAEKGSIILIDNFDYCLTDESCKILTSLIKSLGKNLQIIAEVHNEKMINILEKEGGFTIIKIPRELAHHIKYL